MQGKISRREFGLGLSGIVSGGTIAYLATDGAQGTVIQVDGLEVKDTSESVANPVSGLQLAVNGTWDIDSDNQPSKIVLRVQGRANETNEFQQIQATDYRSDLSASMQREFSLNGNLLDLEGLNAPDLSPQEAGESISETVTVRIVLEVYHDNELTKTHEVQDSAMIEITRTLASTNVTIEATGNMSVKTS
jgi:hypothetical protein